MAQADRDENFRVVRICNGRTVSTPLWTGDDARGVNAQFSYTKEMCISPSDEGDDTAKRVQERLHSRRVEAECETGVGEQGSDRRNETDDAGLGEAVREVSGKDSCAVDRERRRPAL